MLPLPLALCAPAPLLGHAPRGLDGGGGGAAPQPLLVALQRGAHVAGAPAQAAAQVLHDHVAGAALGRQLHQRLAQQRHVLHRVTGWLSAGAYSKSKHPLLCWC